MGSQPKTGPVRRLMQDGPNRLRGCMEGWSGLWVDRGFGPKDVAELHSRAGLAR